MNLFDLIFGCQHERYSWPRTEKAGRRFRVASLETGTYVVCLECGKELPYDWQEMKITTKQEQRRKLAREAEA